jgi:hypothetical protein
LVVRGADGVYPAGSEALVIVAAPFLAGSLFALLGPRPILRWSAVFAAAFAVPLALLTILVIYRGDLEGLGPAPLATIATWALCWIVGFVGAAIFSRVRAWAAEVRAVSLTRWLSGWWGRRTCHHDWELQETQEILGRLHRSSEGVGNHYIYIFRCRNCGATNTQSDRWGPV